MECSDSKDDIGGKLADHAIVTDRIVDGVNGKDWIDLIQRTVLPVFNLSQDLACNIRNVFLPFFNYLWYKSRFSILRYIDFHGTVTAVSLFSFVSVPIILVV